MTCENVLIYQLYENFFSIIFTSDTDLCESLICPKIVFNKKLGISNKTSKHIKTYLYCLTTRKKSKVDATW